MNQRLEGIGMTSRRTRERMVARLREQGIKNQAVLDVMQVTPRHIFVEEALTTRAYDDMPLPIGYNQTISQPYIVARMTDPGWVFLMASAAGLIVEKGSLLTHTAIIGRELGIPTIVGVAGAVSRIKSGSRIRMDGTTGNIELNT